MTQTLTNMSDLYDRLSKIGFPQHFIQDQVLPDWWCPEFEESAGAVVEAASYAARRLSLDLNSILDNEESIAFTSIGQPKFKSQQGSDSEKMKISTALSHRISELVAYSCINDYQSVEEISIEQIRKNLIENSETICLDSLLEFCWQRGIPVIHCNNFPNGAAKFHGMATWIEDRPVIVISLKDLSPSRLLFIVAHELGHIYKGHISGEFGFMVDQKIDLGSIDKEEVEANEFAGELLLGKANMSYYFPQQYNGQGLASYCLRIATRDQISPGLIAWNYAWKDPLEKKRWGLARKAVSILEPEDNAPVQINHHLQNKIDWDLLSEDNQDYLRSFLRLEAI
jgi:Zn-dependent peptidase ImmA (M78 family)